MPASGTCANEFGIGSEQILQSGNVARNDGISRIFEMGFRRIRKGKSFDLAGKLRPAFEAVSPSQNELRPRYRELLRRFSLSAREGLYLFGPLIDGNWKLRRDRQVRQANERFDPRSRPCLKRGGVVGVGCYDEIFG